MKFEEYQQFVDSVTSDTSKDAKLLIDRIKHLSTKTDISRLITSAVGLSDESGEFLGLVKKIVFHNKEYEKLEERLKDELSDVLWYLANACMALDISLDELIEINYNKLRSRYPQGFDPRRKEE